MGHLPLAVALALWCATAQLAAQSIPAGDTEVISRSRFEDGAIGESSGVATGRRLPGILWTHNDGSNPARLYAVDSLGRDRGSLEVVGASNFDWEDLAAGPCPEGSCLYLADTGNNNRRREVFTIYLLPDPSAENLRDGQVPVLDRLDFRYPGEPMDAEALYLDPEGRVYLIGKHHLDGVSHFRLPPAPWPDDTLVAQPISSFRLPGRSRLSRITGADLSPDGLRLVVRTYRDLYFYRRQEDGSILGPDLRCSVLGLESQGEGVAWVTHDRVALTSERGVLGSGVVTVVSCRP